MQHFRDEDLGGFLNQSFVEFCRAQGKANNDSDAVNDKDNEIGSGKEAEGKNNEGDEAQ